MKGLTFQQNMLEIHKYTFIQEPKTISESLEKYLDGMNSGEGTREKVERACHLVLILTHFIGKELIL